jgi:hypothetical protein
MFTIAMHGKINDPPANTATVKNNTHACAETQT